MSTERRPFWYLASISISTRVPWSRSQGTFFWSWISGLLRAVSIVSWNSCVSDFLPVRERMRAGLPVVSCPYITAAEMPMPCWPRVWLSLWNLLP
jgi:hypothetical protein